MKPNIVVIGSTNTDMIIKVPHLPLPGETVLGGEFSILQGGKGANQAVAAARAGGNVTFVSCVGNDHMGKQSLEELSKEGINISNIKIVDSYSSGVAMINVSESGENSISVAPGANSQLLADDIDELTKIIHAADIVLLQLEIPLETVERVIQIANAHKVRIILNPAPGRILNNSLLQRIDVLTPNENEAALIAGIPDSVDDYLALNKVLIGKGSRAVIITLGSNGAFYSENGTQAHVMGYQVKAVDSTAAGDTFNGYLAVALAKGLDMKSAINLANKAASISVTRFGAQPSIPYLSELDSHIYQHA